MINCKTGEKAFKRCWSTCIRTDVFAHIHIVYDGHFPRQIKHL